MHRSEHGRDALLHNISDPWLRRQSDRQGEGEGEDISFLYPILQPLASGDNDIATASSKGGKPKRDKDKNVSKLLPWSQSSGALKLTLYGENPQSSFIDSAWGHVRVPVRELVGQATERTGGVQPEVAGWYRVASLGNNTAVVWG